jgi:hypothetical protein
LQQQLGAGQKEPFLRELPAVAGSSLFFNFFREWAVFRQKNYFKILAGEFLYRIPISTLV